MSLPFPEDPSWSDFAEYHQYLIDAYPNFEEDMEENYPFLPDLLPIQAYEEVAQLKYKDNTTNNQMFVSAQFIIKHSEKLLIVETPYGSIELTIGWKNSTQTGLSFAWNGNVNNPNHLSVVLLSTDTFLP